MGRRSTHRLTVALSALAAGLTVSGLCLAGAADFTARDVAHSLFKSQSGKPVDFSGRNLAGLDLAELDFRGARLSGADLLGADLSGAVLKGSDLTGARLDRSTLTRTDFSGAILENATILRPSIYSSFTAVEANWNDAPKFAKARMAGAKLFGRFDYVDFKGADLKGAVFGGVDPRDENTSLARVGLFSGDFDDANLEGADFTDSRLGFASFTNAKAAGARFTGADLTRADFSGADITGADFTGANLDEANFTNAKGFETVKGLDRANNADRLIR